MIYFCLMLKVGPKLSSHYHSVYQHECTARIQLAIRQAHADRNLEYWIESRTPEDTTPSGSVRFQIQTDTSSWIHKKSERKTSCGISSQERLYTPVEDMTTKSGAKWSGGTHDSLSCQIGAYPKLVARTHFDQTVYTKRRTLQYHPHPHRRPLL